MSHLTYHVPIGKKKAFVLREIIRITLIARQVPSLFVRLSKALSVELARTFLLIGEQLSNTGNLCSLTRYSTFKKKHFTSMYLRSTLEHTNCPV